MRGEYLCGALSILSRPEQVGYRPTMRADACLGCSFLGYRSVSVAPKQCEASKSLLARLVGRASEGREGTKKSLA